MSEANTRVDAVAVLLQLEHEARHAPDEAALRFIVVNRTRALLEYRQAVLAQYNPHGKPRVVAISGVAEVDRNAPFVRWVERLLAQLDTQTLPDKPRTVTAEQVKSHEAHEWPEWSAQHGLCCPLLRGDAQPIGLLWLSREQPWNESEQLLAGHLADAYAHAWSALQIRRPRYLLPRPSRRVLIIVAVLVALLLLVPVRQSALAPAEVVPHNPVVVAAPLRGVIAGFEVKPNSPVKKGQELFHYDDTDFKAKYLVAEKALSVAQAEFLQASQDAFHNAQSSAQTGVLRARIALRTSERDYAQEQLRRTIVTAQRNGIAVYTDPDDWIGKPVVIGERIMQLADPGDTQLRVDLPVADAMSLQPGADVVLFLDTDPLHPLEARVTHASYEAEPTPGGILSYRVYAHFISHTSPRIGLQGTAKLYGPRVALAYYLFRRPIGALRRWLGL